MIRPITTAVTENVLRPVANAAKAAPVFQLLDEDDVQLTDEDDSPLTM